MREARTRSVALKHRFEMPTGLVINSERIRRGAHRYKDNVEREKKLDPRPCLCYRPTGEELGRGL
jgi:hypothetical protein